MKFVHACKKKREKLLKLVENDEKACRERNGGKEFIKKNLNFMPRNS